MRFSKEELIAARAVLSELLSKPNNELINLLDPKTVDNVQRVYSKLLCYEWCEANDTAWEDMTEEDFLSAEEYRFRETYWYSTEVDEETGEETYIYYGSPAY